MSAMMIAILGLGTMGGRAAVRMAQSGLAVHGYDLASGARERASAGGVKTHEHAEEAIRRADIVVLSLPGPRDVTAAARGPLQACPNGTIVVDLSTIDPGTARAASLALRDAGASYLDAPVLGRPDGCGHWTLVVGGPSEDLATAQTVLEASIAARVVRAGDVGAGSVVKLLNNLMFGAINAVTAEVLNTCRRNNVDPATFVEAVAASGAATVSNLFRELGPRMVTDNYDPTFGLGLLHKDNRLALQLALDSGSPSFVASCVDQVNSAAMNAGFAEDDTSVVQEVYRRLSPKGEVW